MRKRSPNPLLSAMAVPVAICVPMMLIHVASILAGPFRCGVVPRLFELSQIVCVPLSPFFHHGWAHLLGNLPPVIVLSTLLTLSLGSAWSAARAIATMSIMGGAIVWLLGSPGLHAGASLMAFSMLGFLVAIPFLSLRGGVGFTPILHIACGVAAMYMYWWLIPSLLEMPDGVSWIAHAGGLSSGVATAIANRLRP